MRQGLSEVHVTGCCVRQSEGSHVKAKATDSDLYLFALLIADGMRRFGVMGFLHQRGSWVQLSKNLVLIIVCRFYRENVLRKCLNMASERPKDEWKPERGIFYPSGSCACLWTLQGRFF